MKSRDLALGMMSLLLTVTGCKSTRDWRNEADSHAEALIKDAQGKVTGQDEAIGRRRRMPLWASAICRIRSAGRRKSI